MSLEDKKLWQKILPLIIGERVKVLTVSTYEERFRPLFKEHTGTITYISSNGDIYVVIDELIRGQRWDIHLKKWDVERI